MNAVLDLILELKRADTFEAINLVLEKAAALIELEYYLFGLSSVQSITKRSTFIVDNYPSEWRKSYDEEKLINLDPVVAYSYDNYLPATWSHIQKVSPKKKGGVDVMKEAASIGLKTGFTIPVHGMQGEFGMLSMALSSDYDEAKLNDILPIMQLLTPALQEAIHRINNKTHQQKIKLTKRENECLLWASEGKSAWEISHIIGCAERTVIFHLSNVCSKLNASNRYQAISKAIMSGLISPSF
ncbi:LuxR family transcriptional regulator [Motilimonas sp. 1_MG-2023]|uniref:helix-turn-helix transcriptional regulator n=1 Tax=unclassified Motilimonas TaxID=2643697 RepID=UPI001E3BD1F7|nr:LuxR family transcriptional regulator [Motilimonas sp. 1_MG-2023]MCE0556481.1 LuxR family transcriptional regulator [Motilimonas sp. E26]MDO6527110.1 LuxR family transcriptional regulator [Motilimonas sp. 1_MG-2023]